jgi:anti-anti-sigma factor
MNVQSSKQGNIPVVQLAGRMDAESAPEFETACEGFLNEGSSHIVVELAGLTYVSSMGLRSFLVIAKKTKAKGGAVLLCGMHGFVKEVFDMTHVTSLFQLFDSTEAALRSI